MGPQGPQGPADFSHVHVFSQGSGSSNSDSKAVHVNCPSPGPFGGLQWIPLGGGVHVFTNNSQIAITQTFPDGYGWTGFAKEVVPTSNEWSMTVFAICAPLPS